MTHKDQAAEKLTNQCALVGRYFTCEQTVNGAAGNLLIFIPAPDKPGHYYTQNVTPEGRGTSRGILKSRAIIGCIGAPGIKEGRQFTTGPQTCS